VGGIAALVTATVGAVLVTRLPRHRIGWLLVLGGLVLAAGGGTTGLADYGLVVHPGGIPGAVWLAWVSQTTWAPEIAVLFILLPLFYPSGRLPSPRWRAVVVIGIALVVVGGVSSALSPWVPDPFPVANPLAVGGAVGSLIWFVNYVLATVLVVSGGALALASLVVRYRRGSTIERQQLKWFAAVASVTLMAGLVSIAANSISGAVPPTGTLGVVNTVASLFIYVGLGLLPAAIGLAILRYRLYDIDLVIRRTLVYGALAVLLAAAYGGSVLLLSALLAPLTAQNSLAVAGSTLLVAALFSPVRGRVRSIVDRRFYRSRYDAGRELANLSARLGGEVDLDGVQTEVLGLVTRTLQPVSASIWLRDRH